MKRFIMLLFVCILILTGCKLEKNQFTKVKDLEYTIVKEDDIPTELKKKIDEQKQQAFKLTYSNGEYLYIVVGYGEQPTGGYSIQVKELYLTNNSIVIDTNLLGPSKEDLVTMVLTYPYIVVKTEYLDKSVVFK